MFNNTKPEPPGYWEPFKKDMFYDLCERLEQAGTLDSTFRTAIIQYVEAYILFEKSALALEDEGAITERINSNDNTVQATNRWYEIYCKQNELLLKLAKEFGLTAKSKKDITSEPFSQNTNTAGGDEYAWRDGQN